MQTIGDIVARNLRGLRVERGLTVSELARRSGVAKGTVSKLEAGQATNPTVETLWALADALGASLSELIVADTPPSRVGRLAEAEWIAGDVLRARIVDKLAGREVHDVSHVRFVSGARRDAGPHRRGAFAHAFVLAGSLRIEGGDRAAVELGPGDYAAFPADEPHAYEALEEGTEALVLLSLPRSGRERDGYTAALLRTTR
jgi:transcriptional regulator with XRE-family HTH domain